MVDKNDKITEIKKFMFTDMKREIDLARKGYDAGNFLCALGLFCYIEFAGSQVCPNTKTKKEQFNSFLKKMGKDYEELIDAEIDIYGDLRCGLAHSYFVGKSCTIAML
ncbi:hypothetical protein GF380_05675, partial [Candidatus Uhrbacteria bacterium]|nr:hypothetical protein [Candidatus Uhrbacteria bacterium]MBD3284490.1 hypothetical protein [Candidatus Uhrbacteria bacterium]